MSRPHAEPDLQFRKVDKGRFVPAYTISRRKHGLVIICIGSVALLIAIGYLTYLLL